MILHQKKTRIFIDGEVLTLPHFSGIGHYTLELVKAIDDIIQYDSRYRVTMGVHFRQREKIAAFGFKNIHIVSTPFSHRIANALKIRGLQPFLDLRFGKYIYLFPNFSSWPLLFSKSVPIIYDLSFEKFPQFAEPRNREFLSAQVALSVKRASLVATISQNSRSEISEHFAYPEDRIGVYYPAVDQKKFKACNRMVVDSMKRRYNIKGDYILFVGNIEPRKNIYSLLLAYERLSVELRMKYALVLIGGKGWRDEEIMSTINRLRRQGNTIIQPRRQIQDSELPALYSGATVFVYPSFYEGFGMPPLEAMACGTPVVTSNNSSLPEVVGNAAVQVNAASVKSIADGMDQVLSDRKMRDRLRASSAEQVCKFSWESSAKKLLDDLSRL